MAVVVQQTIPFSPQSLDLENHGRWNKLFPLLRPSLKRHTLPGGQTVLVDTKRKGKHGVDVVAVSGPPQLSSTLLGDTIAAAIVILNDNKARISAADIAGILQSKSGLLLVRLGRERNFSITDDIVEVELESDLVYDHFLRLLESTSDSVRGSLDALRELVRCFVETAETSHATLHTDLVDSKPAIKHADDVHPFEEAKHAVVRVLSHALRAHIDHPNAVTYSVHYADVNGLSRLESYVLANEIASILGSKHLPYTLSSSMLLDHADLTRGFCISVSVIPTSLLAPQSSVTTLSLDAAHDEHPAALSSRAPAKMTFNDADVRKRIVSSCDALIAAEPTITRYDEIVGDGDCGFTLRDGARKTLAFIADNDLSALPNTLSALVDELEASMGGTSGALYCIFLTALASALGTCDSVAEALKQALSRLLEYTRARLGDRTMLDALIPFVDVLLETGDDEKALSAARDGVERTKDLKASLGRSTYLDEGATKGVPDPGAYGLLVLLEGMCR